MSKAGWIVAMIAGVLLVAAPFARGEMWREGPVMIEAQRACPENVLCPIRWTGPIMHVAADGTVTRNSMKLEDLTRDDLEELVRELATYEVMRSSPAPDRQKR